MPAGLWPAGTIPRRRAIPVPGGCASLREVSPGRQRVGSPNDQKVYFAPTVKKRPTAPDLMPRLVVVDAVLFTRYGSNGAFLSKMFWIDALISTVLHRTPAAEQIERGEGRQLAISVVRVAAQVKAAQSSRAVAVVDEAVRVIGDRAVAVVVGELPLVVDELDRADVVDDAGDRERTSIPGQRQRGTILRRAGAGAQDDRPCVPAYSRSARGDACARTCGCASRRLARSGFLRHRIFILDFSSTSTPSVVV